MLEVCCGLLDVFSHASAGGRPSKGWGGRQSTTAAPGLAALAGSGVGRRSVDGAERAEELRGAQPERVPRRRQVARAPDPESPRGGGLPPVG